MNQCRTLITLTLIFLVSVGCASLAFGQTGKETLTNAKVIELAKIGLSDAIIIEKIRQSDSAFDLSTAGLTQLKAARIGDAVIMAMMSPKSVNPPTAAAPQVAPAGAGVDANSPLATLTPGIYLIQDGTNKEIFPTTFSGGKTSFLGAALTYGIKKAKIKASVRGASANMTIKQTRPEFYFCFEYSAASAGAAMSGGFLAFGATSPGEFVLVKMEKKTKTRETVLGEIGAFSASTGARDKDIQDFAFEKVKSGVFKVVPKADLAPGEYCFFYAGTPAGLGFAGGKLFDFSVSG